MARSPSDGKQAQKRPLRTYSNRITPNHDAEPPSKRRRTDDIDEELPNPTIVVDTPSKPSDSRMKDQSSQSLTSSKVKLPKKGSIMNYFKVTSPSSSILSPCSQSTSEPSSSPPTTEPRKRKPRRLTTRPVPENVSSAPETEPANTQKSSNGTDQETASQIVSGAAPEPTPLGPSSTAVLNRQDATKEQRSDAGKRGMRRRQRPKQATIQTTISLSMNEKVFAECKDCNMLYNPYHEKDVKDHARRHAAFQKAKRGVRRQCENEQLML